MSRTVRVEWHPTYERCLVFSSPEEPYFLFMHKDTGWFGEDGTLFDIYMAPVTIMALTAEGYSIEIDASVRDYMREMYGEEFTPPALLEPTLKAYNFQQYGFKYLVTQPTGLAIWSTGTGKTVLGIMMSAHRLEQNQVDAVVVWTKSHLVPGWFQMFEKFSRLPVMRMDKGTALRRSKLWSDPGDTKVFVLNYEKVSCGDYDHILSALKGKNVLFIFDEVQKLKNRTTALHRNMKKLMKEMKVVYGLGLSATPVESSPVDYYNIFRVLNPDIYGTVKNFEHNYTYAEGARDNYRNYIQFINQQDMRFRSSFMVSIARKTTPEIAAEFPKMQEICTPLELSEQDRKLYEELKQSASKRIGDVIDNGGNPMSLKGLYADALKRVCSLPESLLLSTDTEIVELVSKSKYFDGSKHSVKLHATQDMVADLIAQGEKVAIFYRLTHQGIIPLAQHFLDFNPLMFYGDMPQKKEDVIETFRHSTDRNLMFISDAGKDGLNLPECGYIIHYDTPQLWSTYEQRSNRIHRIDSERDQVTVYRFLTTGTIEVRVEEVKEEHRASAQNFGAADEAMPQSSQSDDYYLIFGTEE